MRIIQPIKLDNDFFGLSLMKARLGDTEFPRYELDSIDGTTDMAKRLKASGGFNQQSRMIRDKQWTLDKVVLYSYQAAVIRKYKQNSVEDKERFVRALINPDKTKMDYDDKMISVQFEYGFQAGDIFKWYQTDTNWLIYLQDLNELAYFRAEIRRCTQEISWTDDEGNIHSTFAAVRGPVETKIDYIQKNGISIDIPNHSLHIYMPKNDDTLDYFQRYSKFYLNKADKVAKQICWRVEATDTISAPNIIELTAVEYYANETEDDIENGLVGALKVEPLDPTPPDPAAIISILGESFILPKEENIYTIGGRIKGTWKVSDGAPVILTPGHDEKGFPIVTVKWTSPYSGQFDLFYGNYKKTITVKSLF